jgi:hypothetical protein
LGNIFLRFFLYYLSVATVIIGAIIYGAENSDMVGWSFWVAFSASILAAINGIVWCVSIQANRLITKRGGSSGGFGGGGLGGDLGGGGLGGCLGGDLGGGGLGGDLGGCSFGGGLGGDLGGGGLGGDLGVDLGGDGLGGNLGGGDLASGGLGGSELGGNIDLGVGGLGGNLDGGGLAGDLSVGGLVSADISDDILKEELKAAPVADLNTEISPVGGIGLSSPLPSLPQSVGLDVNLAQSIDTAGLIVDEHEPSPELTTEQLDYISDLNI